MKAQNADRFVALVVTVAVAMAMAMTAPASAQTRAEIGGTVTDASGAVLPGVSVTLSSPNLVGGPRTGVTKGDGSYRLIELMPGVYELTLELPGFRTFRRTGLRVDFAGTTTVDVRLELAQVAESITVNTAAPVVDVKSSSANQSVDGELLQSVPTSRNLSINAVNLAPGISAAIAYGATSLRAITFRLDGVNTNGVSSGGTLGSYANINWFQEIQVVALGAPAEYGEFTGANANQVIRSGSNRFSGMAEAASSRWEGDNRGGLPLDFQKKFVRQEILSNAEASAQLGGPIIRDRLFFFAGHMYYKNSVLPAGALDRAVFATDHLPRTIGKLNWAASPTVRLEGFLERDKFDTEGFGANLSTRPEALRLRDAPQYKGSARLTWTYKDKTLFEVRNSQLSSTQTVEPTPPGTRTGPAPHRETLTGIVSVNGSSWSVGKETRNVTTATLTRYASGMGRSHDLKFGLDFDRGRAQSQSGYPGGQSYIDFNGAPDQVQLWQGDVTDARTTRTSLYAQDNWVLNDRFTINPGVRVAFLRGTVPVKGTVYSANPISPRIGLAWDPAANHRTVVRAHYGRYHEALLSNMFSFMNTEGRTPVITAKVLGPNNFQELTRVNPAGNFGIDPGVTHPYMDQVTAGVERELFPDFSLQLQYIGRHYANILAFTDPVSTYLPVQRQDPGPDGLLGGADDGSFLTVYELQNPGKAFYLMTNPDGATRKYNGAQIVAKKRFSHNWMMVGNYTWSRTIGLINNNESENAANGPDTGPSRSNIFVNPNAMINAYGNAEIDFTHQVKLEGTYHVAFFGGFNVGGNYQYLTGGAWGRRATIRGLAQGNETIRIEPRGARRDTPALSMIDLRVEKTFPLGAASRTAGIYLDAYNVTNQGTVSFIDGHGVGTIDLSGATFGTPRQWVAPRVLRIGARLTF
jgi:hypothetical protein